MGKATGGGTSGSGSSDGGLIHCSDRCILFFLLWFRFFLVRWSASMEHG
jgi:hypothetical protein